MFTVLVRRIGSEVGVVLPQDVLAKLQLSEGDSPDMRETPSGFVIAAHSSLLARQLEIAVEGMDRFAPALLELAK